jgi:ribosomal protein S27AE
MSDYETLPRKNKDDRKKRKCLRCGKLFMSRNKFNRLCDNCLHYEGI